VCIRKLVELRKKLRCTRNHTIKGILRALDISDIFSPRMNATVQLSELYLLEREFLKLQVGLTWWLHN
jgi:hypothetical protein